MRCSFPHLLNKTEKLLTTQLQKDIIESSNNLCVAISEK